MANTYSGLFQTLAAKFSEASLAKVGKNALLNCVYRDFEPEYAEKFSTINTNVAASTGSAAHVASGSTLTLSDVNANPAPVTLDKHPAYGFALPSFDQARGPSDSLVTKFRDEATKKFADYFNGVIADLITVANFGAYAAVSSGADVVTDAAMGTAWAKLAGNKIPVADYGNLFLIAHPICYANIVQQASWSQSAYVGSDKAQGIRETARLGHQWGAICDWDNDMPADGVRGAAAGTYTSMLFHRYSIACVARAIAPPMDPNVPCTYVSISGIPVRVTVQFNNKTLSDEIVFDGLMGAAVVRPDHGILLTST
jgi:hypothetical protein